VPDVGGSEEKAEGLPPRPGEDSLTVSYAFLICDKKRKKEKKEEYTGFMLTSNF